MILLLYMNRLLNNIYIKIWMWFYHKSPIFISLNPLKCFSDWWKVRKIFRRPVLKFFYKPHEYLGSDYIFISPNSYNYFNISSRRCDFKLKDGTCRFESVPHFAIYWNHKLIFLITLECPFYEQFNGNTFRNNNMLYWEAILGYTYDYNKDLIKTFENNIWKNLDTNINITFINGLKQKYIQMIINYYNKKENETIS